MSSGRIQCLLITDKTGHVVYERFYESFNEQEKTSIRETIDDTAEPRDAPEGSEMVGRFK